MSRRRSVLRVVTNLFHPIDRIEDKIATEPNTGCWLWLGALDGAGYPLTSIRHKTKRVHRLIFESHAGAIPVGLTLDHLCRQRSCVNPAHLEPVTIQENIARGTQGRFQAAKNPLPGRSSIRRGEHHSRGRQASL